jgi:hypothetical protein
MIQSEALPAAVEDDMMRPYWFLVLSLLFSASSTRVHAQDRLVLYYPFQGDAQDASGNGHHGTVVGASLAPDRFGIPGAAYAFDGVDDFIDCGDILNDVEPPFTVSAWMKSDLPVPANRIFTSDEHASAYHGIVLQVLNSPAPRSLEVNYGDGEGVGHQFRRSWVAERVVLEGLWVHVAGVVRSGEDMSVYVNGVDVGGMPSGEGHDIVHGSSPARVGRGLVGGSPVFFEGTLDEIRVHARALSPDEVASFIDVIVAVEASAALPTPAAAHPNPFRTEVTISITEPFEELDAAEVYDAAGRLLRTLPVPGRVGVGRQAGLEWDGCDERGHSMAAGLYLLRFRGAPQRGVVRLLRLP